MSLAAGAVLVGMVWAIGMIAWSWPVGVPEAAMVAVGGVVVALVWYLIMGWWTRRRAAGRDG